MDDDDEDNPKDDKCQKYWIPGLKTIGEFFIAFAVNFVSQEHSYHCNFQRKECLTPSLVLTSYIVYSAIAVTLRYESSTLILYKEQSSPIFQSCQ